MLFLNRALSPPCHGVACLALILNRCHRQITLGRLGNRVRGMAVDTMGCMWIDALPLGQKYMEVIIETFVFSHLRVALET